MYGTQTHQGRTSGQGHGSLLQEGNANDGMSMKSVIINDGKLLLNIICIFFVILLNMQESIIC